MPISEEPQDNVHYMTKSLVTLHACSLPIVKGKLFLETCLNFYDFLSESLEISENLR